MESYRLAFSNSSPDEADIIIFGLPIKEGSENREMERTPDEIRRMSYRIYNSVYGKIMGKKISDIGNLRKEGVKEISKRFVMIGGNHLSTFYALKAGYAMENVKDVAKR
jgi:arginase family enzyme